jgi:hypothetical protein
MYTTLNVLEKEPPPVYFEIPGFQPPAEPHIYTPMGRVDLTVGQTVRYRYYDHNEACYRLGVVVKHLGTFSKTGHPHYEISFTTPVQQTLFPADTFEPTA